MQDRKKTRELKVPGSGRKLAARTAPTNAVRDHVRRADDIGVSPFVFARHETFHPRFGWIKKGYDAALKDPSIFLQDDAPVVLGVGKNMVRAIRYWCVAFKVLTEREGSSRNSHGLVPTEFGSSLLPDGGMDPHLEDPGSLWLLHWKLLSHPCWASAWQFSFGLFPRLEFTADDLAGGLEEWLAREAPASRVVPSSLRKDVNCIIRMYAEVAHGPVVDEDSIHCPFVELGLIRQLPGQKRTYAFNVGAKQGLSSDLVTAMSLEFAANLSTSAKTISISRLLREPHSPGVLLKLNESTLYEALEDAAVVDPRIRLSDTAGLVQLAFTEDPQALSRAFVKRHYKGNVRRRIVA